MKEAGKIYSGAPAVSQATGKVKVKGGALPVIYMKINMSKRLDGNRPCSSRGCDLESYIVKLDSTIPCCCGCSWCSVTG